MPSQDGLRLNHLSRINKARPELSHPYEQRAITAAKAGWRSPQSDGKLMTEKQILSFKPAPRLELVGYKHSERVQNCKHRSQWCDDSALQCEFRSDGIFERARLKAQAFSCNISRCWASGHKGSSPCQLSQNLYNHLPLLSRSRLLLQTRHRFFNAQPQAGNGLFGSRLMGPAVGLLVLNLN